MRMRRALSVLRTIGVTFTLTFRQNLTDGFILFGILFQPLIIAFMALWMLRGQGGDYAIFVIVGSGMSGLWTSLLFISGNSITQERWTGTLEMLIGVPTPLEVVVFGKNLANVVQSLASMAVSYTAVSLILGFPIQVEQPLPFLVSVGLTVMAFVSFGLIVASVFVINPDVQRWQNGLEFPIYILSGFLFPVALLPGWTTPLSYLLTPYWAAQALHMTSRGGGSPPEVLFSWSMLILLSLLSLLLSRRLFRFMLHKARADATLGLQ